MVSRKYNILKNMTLFNIGSSTYNTWTIFVNYKY